MEKIMCECCGVNEAQVKDYRTNEETGELEKYWVCVNCMQLNDYWFYKLLNTPTLLGKKRVISKIVEGKWKKYLLRKEPRRPSKN